MKKNAKIGKNTRTQSHSFICSNVKIGDNCFIGHGVNFINDKFSEKKIINKSNKLLKTVVEDNVLIGSNSTIMPIKIEKRSVIGAGSVVTKNCKKNKVYAGNPAKIIKK